MKTEEEIRAKVTEIATLSNLSFTEDEFVKISPKFEKILNYVAAIDTLDLENVEPMTHVNESHNIFREDVVTLNLKSEDALKNAPKRNESFFKVPKVIE